MFEQPVLDIQDAPSYEAVYSSMHTVLAPASASRFLRQVGKHRLRIRDFESVLAKGLLGQEAIAAYGRLGNLDRGQIREQYLNLVEQVAPELRARHLKVYAYY
jgi:hypothetical protein